MDGKSLNITEDKLAQLKQLFPEVFAEDKIDFDKLKLILGEEMLAKEERYELNWAGKYDAFKEIQKQTTAALIPDPENSIDFDTSENIFIEGENLEALRVLQKSYYGKIKMIYIDPPYNTGNDSFVYPDDYTERRSEYEERTGIKDEDGFLNKQDLWKKNTKENGQFHSVWLSMMYPRLFLARNLMREDGVIFVSIDDNEVSNLKLLMDSIWGGENFRGLINRATGTRMGSGNKKISSEVDYMLVYSKSNEFEFSGLPMNKQDLKIYDQEDKNGKYLIRSLRRTGGENRREDRPSMFYPVKTPDNTTIYPLAPEGWESRWVCGKDTYNQLLKDDMIVWKKVIKKGVEKWQVYQKHYLGDSVKYASNNWNDIDGNKKATREVNKLFEGIKIFDHPKPISLISKIIRISALQQNDIVLDFFTGSGSTAHSILDINQKDNSNRKFICVQMPEPTPENSEAKKAGYKTISQISQARIKKVIEQIKAEQEGKLDFDKDHPQDLGFKSFKLAPSNFKTWRSDAEGEALAEQLALFQSPYKEGTEQENMLYELLLKAGFPLTVPIQKENVEDITLYIVDGGKMLLALEAISEKVIEYVLEVQPQRFVTLDKLFGKDDQLLTNTRLQLQEMGIDFQII